MNLHIRLVLETDIEDLVQVSLSAWIPVFESFKQILGKNIYRLIWPEWKISQRQAVERVCKETEKFSVLVAESVGSERCLAFRFFLPYRSGLLSLLMLC